MGTKRSIRKIGNVFYSAGNFFRENIIFLLISILLILLSPFAIRVLVASSLSDRVFYEVSDIPSQRVALVLGAGLQDKGKPSPVLEDRVLTAVELYKAGKVEKIIMSGDNRTLDYDEPSAMISLAIQNGVKAEDLQPDYAGRRTYDSCYRARNIFSLSEVIVVTQKFHLDRAMYTCGALGIKTYGMTADKREYLDQEYVYVRDTYAFLLAIWDVNFRRPEVVLGDKIEI
ncbi:YdcF family protein [Candidatus Dojkabacteria bacterium]|nr:YdcF family protein [Candidatus Dojkabacteria bacterium]